MYATPADLLNRYPTDPAIVGASEADQLVALDDASDEIDTYLARYGLPLAVVPGRVVAVSCDIAAYRIAGDAALMTEEKRKRYEDAVRWLEKCSTGAIDLTALVTADDGDPETDEAVEAEITYQERLFTRTSMAGVL